MTGTAGRPLLFLDVDGPLIPFGGDAAARPVFRTVPGANPLLARVDPAHGPRLAALPCDLVWATTWMAEANECLAPLLGLPELPVVEWPEPSAADEQDARAGLHWKTRTLLERSGGRAFAWVDDEITDRDRAWMTDRAGGRALLHRVDATRGLTAEDFTVLDRRLRSL
ncbi:HAD domain-containing protein [Kitasatospora sp. NPDC059571]|uniref:HAD domain-containing protein n=1 Tax=Kitasatospora sp. NPDC059571 TaxID=3346871 RepID=UPI0036B04DC2